MSGDPEPAARTDRASRWTSRLDLVVALTTLSVAVAYVALRFAYTRFYDALGVAPEELGLGQVDLLVRSAGLIVVFALPAAAVLEIAALAVGFSAVGLRLYALWALPRQIVEVLSDRRTPRLDVFLVVVGVISWIAVAFPPLHTPRLIGYLPPALALAGAVLVYIHRRGLRRLQEDVRAAALKSWETLHTATAPVVRRWRIGAMLVAAASTVLVFVLVSIAGPIAAQSVQQGRAYRDWSVPWRADPATVRWLHQSPTDDPLSGRCLMYLGQANGIAVLYDVQSRRVVRVPATEVVILVETGAERCPRRA